MSPFFDIYFLLGAGHPATAGEPAAPGIVPARAEKTRPTGVRRARERADLLIFTVTVGFGTLPAQVAVASSGRSLHHS